MWNGPVSKMFAAEITLGRCSHMSDLSMRSLTAGRDGDPRRRSPNHFLVLNGTLSQTV